MHKCYRRYIRGGALEAQESVTVLDIGGADVNGSYRPIFNDPRFKYLSADLVDGPEISIVLEDPYKLPLDDASVDVVLSGQMLEHCEFFWLSFAEMIRVLRPGGYLFLIAPSAGPIHRHPVDCYRFYPDAYRALARYANCRLVEVWCDERGPWNDLVGVFTRHVLPEAGLPPAGDAALSEPQPPTAAHGTPEEEVMAGDRSAYKVLKDIHNLLEPRSYLEIGVETGASLALAACPAVGVDPQPMINVELPESARVIKRTSDDFFPVARKHLKTPPDLIFLDGMHLFEYLLRDFMNAERVAAPHALIVIDDIFPNHRAQAERQRRTRIWAGDVWKLVRCLRQYRPDLYLQTLDSSPTGLLLVAGLNPADRTLWDHYNAIIPGRDKPPPAEVLTREGAVASDRANLRAILQPLIEARDTPFKTTDLVKALRKAAAALTAREPAAAPQT